MIEAGTRDGKRRRIVRRGFATKAKAREAALELERQVREKSLVERNAVTLGVWLEQWLDEAGDRLRPSTLRGYRSAIRRRLAPALGGIRLQDLTQLDIRRAYQDMRGELTPRSVQLHHSVLRRSLADAVSAGLMRDNPADRAFGIKVERPEMKAWAAADLGTFLVHVSADRLLPLWRLLALTGMRRGEALGLRWSDVDFTARVVRVRQSLTRGPRGLFARPPKTARGVRDVDVDRDTIAALRSWKSDQAAEALSFDRVSFEANNPMDLVFTRRDGRPLDPDWVSKRFVSLSANANVPRLRLHDLRHTAATLALRAGTPVHVVSRRLGHTSSSLTLDVYSHVLAEQGREAADQLAQLVDGSSGA